MLSQSILKLADSLELPPEERTSDEAVIEKTIQVVRDLRKEREQVEEEEMAMSFGGQKIDNPLLRDVKRRRMSQR